MPRRFCVCYSTRGRQAECQREHRQNTLWGIAEGYYQAVAEMHCDHVQIRFPWEVAFSILTRHTHSTQFLKRERYSYWTTGIVCFDQEVWIRIGGRKTTSPRDHWPVLPHIGCPCWQAHRTLGQWDCTGNPTPHREDLLYLQSVGDKPIFEIAWCYWPLDDLAQELVGQTRA